MNEELKVIISAEVNKLKQGVQNAKKQIANFKEQVKKASADVDKHFKAMGQGINNALKGVGTAVAGATAALLGVSAATSEYRNEQAKLYTAFEAAGSSAKTAEKTYNSLYRVMGDSGAATEAAQSLARLTTEEQALGEYTTALTGIYSVYGDGMPIEMIAESIAETAACGTVTGDLSRALVEAGVSEDEFNEKLQACATQQEREALIRSTLNGLYGDAAAKYEENNAAVLAQNEANAKLQGTLAALGGAVAPIITAFTSFASDALAVVVPYVQQLAEKYTPLLQTALQGVSEVLGAVMGYLTENWGTVLTVAAVIGGIAAAIGIYNTVAAIKAAMDAMQVTTLWGLVSAYAAQAAAMIVAIAPYLLIVAAIAAVVAAFLWLWENCEGFRVFWLTLWENIKAAFAVFYENFQAVWSVLWENVKAVFAAFVESLKPIWAAIVNAFSEAWELIKVVWDLAKPFFEAIWTAIKTVFSVVGNVLGGFFKVAWSAVKGAWAVASSFFKTVWDTIAGIFSVVRNVLSGNFSGAWEAIKGIFSSVGSFFSGVWNTIKSIFSNVGSAIGDSIKGAVSNAVNGVLSTACNIINGFIGAINTAIGIINAIPGVNIGMISKLSVPKFARGGIVDDATLAVIGEQGKEAVVPLENNLEWLDKLAERINANQGGGSAQIVLQIDGKTFAQTTVDSINALTRQRGSLALNLA
jgi:phage-related protein